MSKTALKSDIIDTGELIQFRTDNIVYFVASDGNPCDEGSQDLIEANKIPIKETLQVGKFSEIKKEANRYLFGLCIRNETPESQEFIKRKLYNTFTLLHESLLNKNIQTFSIALCVMRT